ncbi:FtsH protease activity modulator HflK [Rhodoblastus sp.]|uniref:FtsH protease activity modulator HflK n=1 Tax=Rhodoblastus sp. TaxID=1962975 RepID=UPI0026304D03|nr:FtsH protease activity modulator HflK [Rhodoblastus sp.]
MPWSKPGGDEPPKPEGEKPSDGKRDVGRGPWGASGQGGSNSGNPWGGSGGGPFGGGNFGGGSRGPDLEALARKAQEKLRNLTSGDFSPRVLLLIGAAVGALWLSSGFYTIDPNQIGLNLVFGRYVGKTLPGLNYNWPEPIGQVLKLNVTDRNSIDIGSVGRADQPGAVEVPEESLMLTGDENIVDLKFRVIWQIDPAHPEYFAFNIKNQAETIKAVAESVMRDIVGRTQIQPLLTVARKVIEPQAQEATQKVLDSYGAGVEILQVQLLSVDPPPTVIAAFRDVTAAQQDRSRFVNEAQGEANSIVPNARGEAARILNAAEAYRAQTVAEARGQAARYSKVFGEYQKAPDVTRERLYLETMERVLGAGDKIILDRNSAATPLLPLAPLDAGSKSAPGGNP